MPLYQRQHKYAWQPMSCKNAEARTKRLEEILLSWEGTPYKPFKQQKGKHADCIGFVCAVLNELYGYPQIEIKLPTDLEFRDLESANWATNEVKKNYPHINLRYDTFEPGDVIMLGPTDKGCVHAMIVGFKRNTVWHTTKTTGVCWSGLILPEDKIIYNAFRCADRDKLWI